MPFRNPTLIAEVEAADGGLCLTVAHDVAPSAPVSEAWFWEHVQGALLAKLGDYPLSRVTWSVIPA